MIPMRSRLRICRGGTRGSCKSLGLEDFLNERSSTTAVYLFFLVIGKLLVQRACMVGVSRAGWVFRRAYF